MARRANPMDGVSNSHKTLGQSSRKTPYSLRHTMARSEGGVSQKRRNKMKKLVKVNQSSLIHMDHVNEINET